MYVVTVCAKNENSHRPLLMKGKGKGKAISLQFWTGSEGSRGLRLSEFIIVGTRKL
jgi:hypothetical protein